MASCTSEPAIAKDDLKGEWEVVSAQRNGRDTETVVGAYFAFTGDGMLKTNILNGEEMTGPYEIRDETILHKPQDREILYQASWREDGNLNLTTNLSGFTFQFVLKEKQQE